MADERTWRGRRDTPRWTRRLTLAVGVSLAAHLAVLAVPAPPHVTVPVDVVVNHTVEFGLDEPVHGAATVTPPAPSPDLLAPAATPPPAPAPRVHRAAPRPAAVQPAAPPPALEAPLPEVPDTHLREPLLATHTPDTPSLLLAEDGGVARDGDLAALDDVPAPDDAAVAMADDAGVTADDAAATTVAATVDDAGTGLPGMASAVPDLAPAVPAGAVVTLLLRADRLRANPNGDRARDLLLAIPDWQDVLGGTELDPVRDFDTVLLASADPFGDATHPPDLVALVRLHAPRAFIRASVEQMAGARPPQDPDGGTLRERFVAGADAGVLPRASRVVWRRQGGADVATLDRTRGRQAFMLFNGGVAAIAPPERVPALLAVLARRPPAATAGDPRLVALLQAQGVRNLLRARSGPSALPTHADLGVLATAADGEPDGGATLVGVCQYDSAAQATRAAFLFGLVIRDVDRMLSQFEHSLAGLGAAAAGAVHFPVLHATLAAVHAEADGDQLRLSGTLTAEEVSEVLNVQRLAGLFQ